MRLGAAKQRALLGVLLLHANETVSTGRLVDELWGERPPATAEKLVQGYVHALRRQLGDGVLETRAPGYRLTVDGSLDLAEFELLLEEAGRAPLAESVELRRRALELWRGSPLADVVLEGPDRSTLARLSELQLATQVDQIDAELELGRHEKLIGELEALRSAHPYQERLAGQLMLALYRSGRQAEALEVYRTVRARLDDELGLQPGRELRELERAILDQDPAIAAPARPKPSETPRGPLPVGTVTLLSSDIERSTELVRGLGPDAWGRVLSRHQALMRESFAANGGSEVDTQGDAFFVSFTRAADAVRAAVAAQGAHLAEDWLDGARVAVRIGLHTGTPTRGDERYVGLDVHRVARVTAAAHGGEILCTAATAGLVDADEAGVRFDELGTYRLKDFPQPERLFRIVSDGLSDSFPPPALPRAAIRARRRRRLLLLAAIATLVAAITLVAAVLVGRDPAPVVVPPNYVAIIDADANRVVGTVQVGIQPGPIAAGDGAVWVGNLEDRSLTRIDPETRQVVDNIPLPATPHAIAVGDGAVWVVNGRLGKLYRVDAELGAVSDPIQLADRVSFTGGGVAVDDGSVWAVFGDSTLARVSSRAFEELGAGVAGGGAAAVTVGYESVWVANSGASSVHRFNPLTFESGAVDELPVGRAPTGLAAGENAVWVTNRDDDYVTRLDAAIAFSPTPPIPVGDGPSGIAVGDGAVWVANTVIRHGVPHRPGVQRGRRDDRARERGCGSRRGRGLDLGDGAGAVARPPSALQAGDCQVEHGTEHDAADAVRDQRHLVHDSHCRERRVPAGDQRVELSVGGVPRAPLRRPCRPLQLAAGLGRAEPRQRRTVEDLRLEQLVEVRVRLGDARRPEDEGHVPALAPARELLQVRSRRDVNRGLVDDDLEPDPGELLLHELRRLDGELEIGREELDLPAAEVPPRERPRLGQVGPSERVTFASLNPGTLCGRYWSVSTCPLGPPPVVPSSRRSSARLIARLNLGLLRKSGARS